MQTMQAVIFIAKKDEGGLLAIAIMVGWLIVLAVIVLTVTQITRWREKVRTGRLAEAVKELGLAFQPTGDQALYERLASFPLLNAGRKQELKNLVSVDTSQAQVAIFDFRYITGHGKNKKVHRQTVIAMEAGELELPIFSMRPERIWDKVGSLFGGQDIDFSQHQNFSAKFVLKGESEEAVRSYLDQELLDFFATREDIWCEARPGAMLYYRRGKRVPAEAAGWQGFMQEGMEVFVELLARQSREVS